MGTAAGRCVAVAARGGNVQDELEPIIEDLRGDLDDTMSKSQAAKVIGVSVPTLDKWIEQRIIPMERATSERMAASIDGKASSPFSPVSIYGKWFSVLMVGFCAAWLLAI